MTCVVVFGGAEVVGMGLGRLAFLAIEKRFKNWLNQSGTKVVVRMVIFGEEVGGFRVVVVVVCELMVLGSAVVVGLVLSCFVVGSAVVICARIWLNQSGYDVDV